jgi:hypothetical protein
VVAYRFTFSDADEVEEESEETPYLLTPPAPAQPRINCASVAGARPGHPFLFTVATSGERPMKFSARRLPRYLRIDPETGIISGNPQRRGNYRVTVFATNRHGSDRKQIRIQIGDRIALTPPLGFNSWNCWGLSVTQEQILSAAQAFVDKKLINYGWTYINIDDGWSIKGDSPNLSRDPSGRILTNEKFPDIRGLAGRVHRMGLKLGIYSSPGPLTCGGYAGSHGHILRDLQTFAGWGVDYLKYDWCSYEGIAADHSLEELQKPYRELGEAMQKVNRDIVFSICQYGMGKVWEWGEDAGGNLWRTTGDITDTWESMSGIGFGQVENGSYAGPGHWNDPDMLVVGWVGWGPDLHPTRLSPDEQYTHISLWSLLAAPLLIGCDLQRLDPFTLNLLTNREVLAVNQDPAGKQGYPVVREGGIQVWVKPLADQNRAVGVFNLNGETRGYTLDLRDLGIHRPVKIRDLWRQHNLGDFSTFLKLKLPAHGVILLRLTSLK